MTLHRVRALAVAGLVGLIVGVGPLLVDPPQAAAASFTVTTKADGADDVIDGVCYSSAADACTIRAAVQEANAAGAGPHTIVLDPAFAATTEPFVLDINGPGEDDSATGDLDIHVEIRITGYLTDDPVPCGSSAPGIYGGDLDDRAWHVHGAGVLTLELLGACNFSVDGDGGTIHNSGTVVIDTDGLVLTDQEWWYPISSSSATGRGGQVFNDVGATFTVDHSVEPMYVIFNSGQAVEGGIFYNSGEMFLDGGTTGSDIYLENGNAVDGAGISNDVTGDLYLGARVIPRWNTATTNGGAVFNEGLLTMSGAWPHNNAAERGGGVYSAAGADLEIDASSELPDQSSFSYNVASISGGAIHNEGDMTFGDPTTGIHMTMYDNAAGEDGGGIYHRTGTFHVLESAYVDISRGTDPDLEHHAERGGGIYQHDAAVNIAGTINFRDLSAETSGGGYYGTPDATLSVDLDTGSLQFMGNEAAVAAGGAYSAGTTALANTTFVENESVDGAGLYVESGATVVERSTFVANAATSGGAMSAVSPGAPTSLSVRNSTFSMNRADTGSVVYAEDASVLFEHVTAARTPDSGGPAVHLANVSTDVTLQRVLFAELIVDSCSGAAVPTTGDWNVFSDSSCNPTATDTVSAAAANLEPLTQNNPFTSTYTPMMSNPAVDYIDDTSVCPPLDVDQNVDPRPVNVTEAPEPYCDAGAVERQSSDGGGGGGDGDHTISGRVISALDGGPVVGSCVLATDTDSVFVTATVGPDGNYLVTGLPAASYVVLFFDPGAGNCESFPPSGVGTYAPELWRNAFFDWNASEEPTGFEMVTVGPDAVDVNACLDVTSPGPDYDACVAEFDGGGTNVDPPHTNPGGDPTDDGVGTGDAGRGAPNGNADNALAFTGSSVALALAGLAMLMAGAALVAWRRRISPTT